MAITLQEISYTLQIDEVRPGDFVARALVFPNLLAPGDTADGAIARARSLLTYYARDARQGEPIPDDITDGHAPGRQRVTVNGSG